MARGGGSGQKIQLVFFELFFENLGEIKNKYFFFCKHLTEQVVMHVLQLKVKTKNAKKGFYF